MFEAVPRHLFLPDRLWRALPAGGYADVDRGRDAAACWELAYADEPAITRLAVDEAGRERSVSSASMPTMVARMLAELGPHEGEFVLEIGTGSGYNVALLATRLGADNVTSIDVDPSLAADARRALEAVGLRPQLVVGDGTLGHAAGAPYDRVEATGAVRRVPYAWIQQTRPGGRILTPWIGGGNGAGHLLVLDVDDTGTATGRLVGDSAFMTLTGHHDPTWTGPGGECPDRDSSIDPAELADPALLSVLGVVLPDVRCATHLDDTGHLRAQAWGPDGTYAWAVSDPDGDHPAWPRGPHDLWDRVEDAVAWWHTTGRPGPRDLLYTAAPKRQFVTCKGTDEREWDVSA